MSNQYGTVTHSGKTLTLTQQAYVSNNGTDGGVRYYAAAIDADGNEYMVAWDTTPAWDERLAANDESDSFDESEACDWDTPADIREL